METFSSEINLVSPQAKRQLCHASTMTAASKSASSARRQGLAQSLRFILPHVILIIVYLVYLVLGGFIFSALESPLYNQLSAEEHAKIAEAQHTKQIILEAYNNVSIGMIKLDHANISALLDSLIDTVDHPDWKAGRQKTLMMGRDWSFPSAMLFSMTTITTIGYGDLVPETVTGKAVCVMYSAIGIPYSFFLLADIGQVLAFGFIRFIRWTNLCRSTKGRGKSKTDEGDMYDDQSRQTQRRKTTNKRKTKRFRGPLPNVTMRHLQSVRFSAENEENSDRRATVKNTNGTDNDKVIGMTVLDGVHEDAPSPNTNNSGLDQSSPPSCNEAPDTSVTTVTTSFYEKKEPVQTKEITTETDKDSNSDEFSGDDEDYPPDEVSLLLVLFTLCSYICISAFAFSLVEDWTFGTAFYFTFITLTTVGFGDIVPEEQYGEARFFFCLLFTVFGLAVTSMCIALVQDRATRAGRRLLGYLHNRSRSKDVEDPKDSGSVNRDGRCKEG